MAECKAMVSSGNLAYPCVVEGTGHDGPCMAREIPRSVRVRREWEDEQKRSQRMPTLESLGMQGAPKSSAAGLMMRDPQGKPIHRYHPDQIHHMENDSDYDYEPPENQRVNRAGGVDISGVTIGPDERLSASEAHQAQARGSEWKQWDRGGSKHVAAAPEEPWTAQPPPEQFDGTDEPIPGGVWSAVLSDMSEREQYGKAKYGTTVQPFNGRNPVSDLYEELLDAVVYVRSYLFEQAALYAVVQDLESLLADRSPTVLEALGRLKALVSHRAE